MRFSVGEMERARNFSNSQAKCMNCAKVFEAGRGVYERRFCSDTCRQEYFS